MRSWLLLLPLVALGLAGCIDVHEHPPPRHETTVVTPPSDAPPAAYAPPGSTVVTRP